jgi:hypothetical protein
VTPHDVSVVNTNGEREAVAGRWTLEVHHQGRLAIPVYVA